jgi:hypothetical protein
MSSNNASVVLAHGAWADGSSWAKIIVPLVADGVNVTAAPLPLTSFLAIAAVAPPSPARREAPGRRALTEGSQMNKLYLEDFRVGQIFGSGRLRVDVDEIKAFATRSLSTWTKRRPKARSSAVWPQAGGIPLH